MSNTRSHEVEKKESTFNLPTRRYISKCDLEEHAALVTVLEAIEDLGLSTKINQYLYQHGVRIED